MRDCCRALEWVVEGVRLDADEEHVKGKSSLVVEYNGTGQIKAREKGIKVM